jgi:hypothetical protein
MDQTLKIGVWIGYNILWLIVFLRCLWNMVTGFIGTRQRMYEVGAATGRSFFWNVQTLVFAFRETPRSPISRRLVRGWSGALGLIAVQLVILELVIHAGLMHRAHG